MRIHDPQFLRRLLREFARRTLTDRASLARFSIDVSRGRQAIDDIRLDVFDDAGLHIITLGLHWLRGATVLYADQPNRVLLAVNNRDATPDTLHERLTRLVLLFCKRHGIVDAEGRVALGEKRATA